MQWRMKKASSEARGLNLDREQKFFQAEIPEGKFQGAKLSDPKRSGVNVFAVFRERVATWLGVATRGVVDDECVDMGVSHSI